jgi:hypothetical protein
MAAALSRLVSSLPQVMLVGAVGVGRIAYFEVEHSDAVAAVVAFVAGAAYDVDAEDVVEDSHILVTVAAGLEAADVVVADDEARHGKGFRLTAGPVDLHKYEAWTCVVVAPDKPCACLALYHMVPTWLCVVDAPGIFDEVPPSMTFLSTR